MREIKFRAWDGVKMRTVYSVNTSGTCIVKVNGKGKGTIRETITAELMQFTGLHDKNGKEIYEGDIIVRVEVQYGTGMRLEFDRQEVEMKPFYFSDYEDSCCGSGFMVDSCDLQTIKEKYEVIGNIYESPQLLKSK